jgi:hypothetical protein
VCVYERYEHILQAIIDLRESAFQNFNHATPHNEWHSLRLPQIRNPLPINSITFPSILIQFSSVHLSGLKSIKALGFAMKLRTMPVSPLLSGVLILI